MRWAQGAAWPHWLVGIALQWSCLVPTSQAQDRSTAEPTAPAPDRSEQQELIHGARPAGPRAKQLFTEGLRMAEQERWSEAELLFRRSADLVSRPSTLYNLAIVLFRLGRLQAYLETAERYEAARDPQGTTQHMTDELAKLSDLARQRLSHLTVVISPPHARLRVNGVVVEADGARRELVLDPGRHQLSASADNHVGRSLQVTLEGASRTTLEVTLEAEHAAPTPSADASTQRGDTPETRAAPVGPVGADPAQAARATPAPPTSPTSPASLPFAYALVGTGAAALVASAVTGVLALEADGDFVSACPELVDCDRGLKPTMDRAKRLATASDVLWVGGAVLAAAGIGLWWLGRESGETALGAQVGASGAHLKLTGRF